MPGTYNIVERLTTYKEVPTPAEKFCVLVSFNGKDAEYYEVESTDASFIAETLQKAADDALAVDAAAASASPDISIVDGQVVV